MQKFRFTEWDVYKEAKSIIPIILSIVSKLPKEYRFELGSQIVRSSFSITLNIAEGSGKSGDKELNRFLDIALGSTYETFAAMDILKENKFITEPEFQLISDKLYNISNQLGGFKRKLKSR